METMDKITIQLLIDLHKSNPRQWPGSNEETLQALHLLNLDPNQPITIADIWCWTGASTILLAQHTKSKIVAIDLFDEFLHKLENNAKKAGVAEQITPLACSMDALPFSDEAFDLIWAEWSIYNIWFEHGIKTWKPYIKPGGYLAVSEITWTTQQRPQEIEEYRNNEYPEINTADKKISILQEQWCSLVGYFTLKQESWINNYYRPLEETFDRFLQEHDLSSKAQEIVTLERKEIELYQKYKDYYSYGFYVVRKL